MPNISQGAEPRGRVVKLVNRGGAGLLNKPSAARASEPLPAVTGPVDRIAPALRGLTVKIDSLTPDPENARMHPEKNLHAIKQSLAEFGQQKPLVVRKKTGIVVAGNGTLQAAKELGWTKLAASFVEMTEAEAAAYGLADNKTAELARWDFEVMARLEKLIAEQSSCTMIGWTPDEIASMRAGGWVEPPADFPAVDENLQTDHICPRCGYKFSGGETVARESENGEAE